MNLLVKYFSALAFGLSAVSSFAVNLPKFLTTYNNTDVESNAYIDGIVPSPFPTKAKSINKLSWMYVQMACVNHTTNGICSANIIMESNTSHPVDLGQIHLNLKTGEFSPNLLSSNGYTLKVARNNDAIEATIDK